MYQLLPFKPLPLQVPLEVHAFQKFIKWFYTQFVFYDPEREMHHGIIFVMKVCITNGNVSLYNCQADTKLLLVVART